MAIAIHYGAPVHTFTYLSSVELPSNQGSQHICIGKEWYRFPSSFWLPSPRTELNFIRSGFNGQLPKPFESTWITPPDFNDENREEMARYVCLIFVFLTILRSKFQLVTILSIWNSKVKKKNPSPQIQNIKSYSKLHSLMQKNLIHFFVHFTFLILTPTLHSTIPTNYSKENSKILKRLRFIRLFSESL